MRSHDMTNVGITYPACQATPTLPTQPSPTDYAGMAPNPKNRPNAELGARIARARTARGLTQLDIAKHFSIERVSVTQWESGVTKPEGDKLPGLADRLGIPLQWLMTGKGDPDVEPPKPGEPQRPISRDLLVGARDLPVYGCAQGGDGDVIIVDNNPIEWVLRPEPLFNVPGGFAIYLVGDSMEPVYRQGDRVLIHPSLPAARGEDAMLVRQLPVGFHALVKRVVGWDREKWNLRQFNPAKDFSLPRAEWPSAYSVVGKYNRR